MKILIIEDEKPAARQLERTLSKLGYVVNEKLATVEDSIRWFAENEEPDLIFLDIQLSDGLSFEIFENKTINSAIIFTTAYDEYALRAFKLNSIDYLLKPILQEDLESALQKYSNQKASFFHFSEQLNLFKMFMKETQKEFKERFAIKIGNQIKIINTQSIVGFYSENKATYILTRDQRTYLIEYSLEQLEQNLNPEQFFRISRKHILALGEIKEITIYSNARLKVTLQNFPNEQDWVVSRERVADFKTWIE